MTATNLDYTKTIMSNAFSGSTREKSVVMFHIGRSGSTVLGHLFNQNPSIFWDSEIFMRNRMPTSLRPLTKTIFSFPSLIVRTRRMRTTKPIYGFEAKLAHVGRVGRTLPEFIEDMQILGFDHFVMLRRRNQLRAIISHFMAKQQGYWHKQNQGSSGSSKVELNVDMINMGSVYNEKPSSLIAHMDSVEQNFTQLSSLLSGLPLLELVYEDHIENNPTDAYHSVCQFLDVEPSVAEVQLKKTNPGPIKDLVSNYDEVAKALSHTPYEWMLDS